MRTVVIGGGLTGLVAALELDSPVVMESNQNLGGSVGSYDVGSYSIERFYHHFFTQDRELISLIKRLGLGSRIYWRTVGVGSYVDEIHPLSTPLQILRYPHLSLSDKIRLAWMTIGSRFSSIDTLNEISAREFVERRSRSLYRNFFLPLILSKFGDENVSAAWLMGRIRIRSSRRLRGEKLGYLRGGFKHLIQKLAERIDGEVRCNCRVKRILVSNGRVRSVLTNQGEIECDVLISTVPPIELEKLVRLNLPKIKYGGALCMLLSTEDRMMDGIYWLNVGGGFPFGAVIEHTNFLPVEDYGEHLTYLASYPAENDIRWRTNDEELSKLYLQSARKIFPKMNVRWFKISRERYAGPIYEVGYHPLPYRTEVGGLYICGMFSPPNFPERSMNGCVKAAMECVEVLNGG